MNLQYSIATRVLLVIADVIAFDAIVPVAEHSAVCDNGDGNLIATFCIQVIFVLLLVIGIRKGRR